MAQVRASLPTAGRSEVSALRIAGDRCRLCAHSVMPLKNVAFHIL